MTQGAAIFLAGSLGALAVEVMKLYLGFQRGRVPKRFKDVWFLLLWLVAVLMAGSIASFVYELTNKIAAFHVGASLPYFVGLIAKKEVFIDE